MANKHMKTGFAVWLLTLALILAAIPALALSAWPVHTAGEVDLSGIVEKDGRLIGSVTTFRPANGSQVLFIDCPVPAAFTQEQWQTIKVEYAKFNQKALTAALEKMGANMKKGTISLYNIDSQARVATYRMENLLETFDFGSLCHPDAITEPDMAHPKAGQMAAASLLAVDFLKDLGYSPYEEGVTAYRLYDPATYGLYPQRSDWKLFQEELNHLHAKQQKKYGRTEFDYTVVKAVLTLRGIPAAPQFDWPSGDKREPDARTGLTSQANIVVKDDGSVVDVFLCALPVEKSAVPIAGSAASWQAAMKEWIATYYTGRANPEDITFTDTTREREVTDYASRAVVTEIKPAYMSYEKFTYVPAWCFVVEERLMKDDTVVDRQVIYLDAAALSNPSMLAYK